MTVAVFIEHLTTVIRRGCDNYLNLEIRIMRRWRFIPFVTLALALLAVPARLPAQEAAKKGLRRPVRPPCSGSGSRGRERVSLLRVHG